MAERKIKISAVVKINFNKMNIHYKLKIFLIFHNWRPVKGYIKCFKLIFIYIIKAKYCRESFFLLLLFTKIVDRFTYNPVHTPPQTFGEE